jgi:hypothetical protein
MNRAILYFIRLNGIYDLLCGFSILGYLPVYLVNNIHLSMIDHYNYNNKIFERFFAYWILTYGIIRCISYEKNILMLSYLIEALAFANEFCVNKNMNTFRTFFVIGFSLCISQFVDYLY